jgi:dUTP pyrophosphatase
MVPKIFIKRIDTTLPLPTYHTKGAAALDLYAREEVTFEPGALHRVPLNVVIQPPEGYWGLLNPRSSLHKRGLIPAGGIGIMDPDFCGDGDEYRAALYNAHHESVTIERGERIMQVVFLPLVKPTIEEVTTMPSPSRGGFGTTGRIA